MLACLAGSAAVGQSDPDALRGQRHDFGTVHQGHSVVHAFTLRNDRAAPLIIERVDLSDGGMAAKFARVIPAGHDGQIRIEWDTAHVAGEVEAEGVVRFAEPTQPPLTLRLTGVVRPSIEFLPYPAVFASLFVGEGAERRVRVVNHEERPLAITRLEADGRRFAAALDTLEAGKLYDLRVRISPELPPGRYEDIIYLDTDHPLRTRIPIAVNVLVKAEIYANPEAVDFGTLSQEELARSPSLVEHLSQTVLVKKRKGEFAVKALASDLPFVRIRCSPSGSSGAFRIDVGLDAESLPRGPILGSVRIATTDDSFPELVIPVRGELR